MPPRPARTARTVAVSGALLLTLVSCERPTPGVTLVSGSRSVHAEAAQYCRGAQTLTARKDECPGTESGVTILRADQDGLVGVDVDKKLTETGWFLYDLDAQRSYGFQDSHYLSFVADFSNRPTPGLINLEVRQVDRAPRDQNDLPKVIGLWSFQVVQTT